MTKEVTYRREVMHPTRTIDPESIAPEFDALPTVLSGAGWDFDR